jgi:hypothetical protein
MVFEKCAKERFRAGTSPNHHLQEQHNGETMVAMTTVTYQPSSEN